MKATPEADANFLRNSRNAVAAINEGRAEPVDQEHMNRLERPNPQRIDFLYRATETAPYDKRECFYLGILKALSFLGADEMMSEERRTQAARDMILEAKTFFEARRLGV
jgi:hypothetical protein